MREKALFLDRDGVINIDYGYVSKIEDFEFNEGLFELLHLFANQGYKLFIVTNQSGIGRGYYTHQDFLNLTNWMLNELQQQGLKVEKVEYCFHAPEELCSCRKPAIGMVSNILSHYNIDLENSWLIGDKQSDIDLAHNALIGHTIAVGERTIENVELFFKTILEVKSFLEENHGRIR